MESRKYQKPLLGLIEHLPECVPILFDRCITESHDDRKHKEFHVSDHFGCCALLIFLSMLAYLRFSLYQLDGQEKHRRERISISNVAIECKCIHLTEKSVSFIPIDDGQIWSY